MQFIWFNRQLPKYLAPPRCHLWHIPRHRPEQHHRQPRHFLRCGGHQALSQDYRLIQPTAVVFMQCLCKCQQPPKLPDSVLRRVEHDRSACAAAHQQFLFVQLGTQWCAGHPGLDGYAPAARQRRTDTECSSQFTGSLLSRHLCRRQRGHQHH